MTEYQTDPDKLPVIEERFELLDGLRFAAALAVMLFHFGFRTWNGSVPGYLEYPLLGDVAKYGYLGVDLFFMISGFVILMSASRGNVAAFVHSRFVRLYPAYWFCVMATFTFLSWWHWGDANALSMHEFLINMTMLQSFVGIQHIDGSYWTLIVELHFYALIVLVLWVGQIGNIDRILALWLVAGIAADFVPGVEAIGGIYAASWCHYFVAGALAYRMRTAGISIFRLAVFCAAFLQAARHAHWYMALKQKLTHVSYDIWVVQLIVMLMFGLFVLLALGRLNFRHSSLRTIGALTYPLYLIHGAIGSTLLVYWVRQYEMNHWVALVIVCFMSITCAWLVHRCVELPIASRLRDLGKRRKNKISVSEIV